jgi:selenide,water dikinase
VGIDTSDDAAVYKIDEDKAVILTTDFFTPIVDDPYTFGQIAAANSLSDVYAMGGRPITAMNIVCFPTCLSMDILKEILRGGADKVAEAGAIVVGGHSVEDDEPKFGLSVMGMVHPGKVTANSGAKIGDMLILTKPLGVGILNTAIKADLTDEATYEKAVESMSYLNRDACEAMIKAGINGCTDVTGFGLLGHAYEMAEASNVSLEIWSDYLPIIKESIGFAKMGIIPAGTYNNEGYLKGHISFSGGIKQEIKDIMYDPQTSGGLLISVPEENSEKLLEELRKNNKTDFNLIGKVKAKGEYAIKVI